MRIGPRSTDSDGNLVKPGIELRESTITKMPCSHILKEGRRQKRTQQSARGVSGREKVKSRCVVEYIKFFKALGQRVKELRKRRGYSQEDMIAFGFSARHWQQIEAGRPITMTTLLRVCDALIIEFELQ
jgi:DNA-binding XRE family transcriptional regulator